MLIRTIWEELKMSCKGVTISGLFASLNKEEGKFGDNGWLFGSDV